MVFHLRRMPRIGGIKISAKKKITELEYIKYRIMGLEESESRNLTRLNSFASSGGPSYGVAGHISFSLLRVRFFPLKFCLEKSVNCFRGSDLLWLIP